MTSVTRPEASMLRTVLLALIGLTLGLGVLVAPSSAATATAPRTTTGYEPTWGRTSAPNQTLRRGCRNYRLSYRVTPPGSRWTAELRVLSPRGRSVAARTLVSEKDAAAGVRRFQLCRATVAPGRFTIRMLVTSYADRYDDGSVARVAPSHFRLRRPR
ncbi:hypothetical protein [Nocardioides lijunqiniae]|uniref:hypothetical protein n=1 Tax=Nocardioides lijunqiniae TaxID=2760832 RepID=UPI00187782BD|nr:hypothetical protein [Nocardioides lijunqiniae]